MCDIYQLIFCRETRPGLIDTCEYNSSSTMNRKYAISRIQKYYGYIHTYVTGFLIIKQGWLWSSNYIFKSLWKKFDNCKQFIILYLIINVTYIYNLTT